jgi:small GTP-binding protein
MSCQVITNEDEIIHFTKINIFGDSGVGKSTLISRLENYNNKDFTIKNNSFNEGEDNNKDSFDNSSSIIEQIKSFKCKLNEKDELYLNIYETNLNRYSTIQMNLDTLLVQTEYIIMIWDNNDPDTFENIPKLVDTIESGIKSRKFPNVPIFLIQNKTDLESNNSQASKKSMKNNNVGDIVTTIKKLKEENQNIRHQKMSLYNDDDYPSLLLDIKREINNIDNKNNNNEAIEIVNYISPFTNVNDEDDDDNDLLSITLLGSIAAGKTSFIQNLKNSNILDIKETMEEDDFKMLCEVNKEKIVIHFLDTKGQEIDQNDEVYKNAYGFLLFFDVTNRESFNEIDSHFSKIENYNDSKEIILLGNKIDNNDKRIVKKQEAKDKADQLGIKYFEISCLSGINILEVLNEIISMSYKRFKKTNDIKILKNTEAIEKEKNEDCSGCYII